MNIFRALATIALPLAALPGCTESSPAGSDGSSDGRRIYSQQCTLCHGTDGRLKLSGATDLALSAMPRNEVVEVVTNGRNNMQAFKKILSPEQVEAVTDYVITLRETN